MPDGTVVRVYDPSLGDIGSNNLEFPLVSQGDLRVVVPQPPYSCGSTEKSWERKPTIYFSMTGRLGVKLLDVVNGKFEGMDERDEWPFDDSCRGITIRIHVSSWGRLFASNDSFASSSKAMYPAPMLRGR